MSFRILNITGTPRSDGKRLCDSCTHGTVMKGENFEEKVFCTLRFSERAVELKFNVTQCSTYANVLEPSIHDMVRMAWVLNTNKKFPIGFMSPVEWRKRNQDDEVIPGY